MKNNLLKLLFLSFVLFYSSIESKNYYNSKQKTTTPFVSGGISHIKQRHWYNAQTNPPTSRFNQSMTISKLNQLATKTIQQGQVQPSNNGKTVHDYTFNRPIGRSNTGKRAYTLRVVTNSRGEIITAFPNK